MMMYDLTGIMCHIRRLSTSIFLMRCTFLNTILMNILENRNNVMAQQTIIMAVVVPWFIHATTPILHTLNPAASQMMPAMKASSFVLIP